MKSPRPTIRRLSVATAAAVLSTTIWAAGALPAQAAGASSSVALNLATTPDKKPLVLDLTSVPIAGKDFAVQVQQPDGTFQDQTAATSIPETFLGTVEGHPEAFVAATRLSTGDTWGEVIFDRGVTWFFKDNTVTSTRGALPTSYNIWPLRQTMTTDQVGIGQYSYEVGYDVDNAYFTSKAASSVVTVVDRAAYSLNNERAIYMQDLGLMPQLGTVRIRAAAAVDPYSAAAATPAAYLPILRTQWNATTAPNQQVSVVSSRISGGVGYEQGFNPMWNFSSGGVSPDGSWDLVFRHEHTHNFNINDEHGGDFEGATIQSGNALARYDASELHGIALTRSKHITAADVVLTPQGTYTTTNIPPYAGTDLVNAVSSAAPATFNPLVNDHSANGSPLTVTAVDATSTLGNAVTLNQDGTISYTPSATPTATLDHFFYTVTDGNGLTARGLVLVKNSLPSITNEAETATLTGGAIIAGLVADSQGDFSGPGFAALPKVGATLETTITSPVARDVTLTVRTKNAAAGTADITVNGATVASQAAVPAATAGPEKEGTIWTDQTYPIHLNAGPNTVTYRADDTAQKVDYLRVDFPDRAPAPQPANLTLTAGVPVPAGTKLNGADPESDPVSFTAANVPAGLALATDGTVSGTPTAATTFGGTFTATDALGLTATAPLSISVDQAAAPVEPTPTPTPTPTDNPTPTPTAPTGPAPTDTPAPTPDPTVPTTPTPATVTTPTSAPATPVPTPAPTSTPSGSGALAHTGSSTSAWSWRSAGAAGLLILLGVLFKMFNKR